MKRMLVICLMMAALAPPALALQPQITPPGVARVGAVTGTHGDYSRVGVAVVDTGIDLENPDLNVVGGVDCAAPPQQLLPFQMHTEVLDNMTGMGNPHATGYEDGVGHGTHVSGIIGAEDNAIGVVGVAPNASLYAVKVLGDDGSGSMDSIVCGLSWVHANRSLIDVVNMSLGTDQLDAELLASLQTCHDAPTLPEDVPIPVTDARQDDPMHLAICQLVDDGIPVVVAAGNGDGDAGSALPSAYPEVFTVSSFVDTDGQPGGLGGRVDPALCPFGGWDDKLFYFKNFTPEQRYSSYEGRAVDFSAPGVCVLSYVAGLDGSVMPLAELTGTSMATPHVTGVVARYIQDHLFASQTPEQYRTQRGHQTVLDIKKALITGGEPQTTFFGDADGWHEPLIRVVPVIVDPHPWCVPLLPC